MRKRLFITAILLINLGLLAVVTKTNIETAKQVEPYCAVANMHDVEGYKACKAQSPKQILEGLTQQAKERNEIPNLAMLKLAE